MENKEKESKDILLPVISITTVTNVIKKEEGINSNNSNQNNRLQYLLSEELGFTKGKSDKERYTILLYDHPEGLTDAQAADKLTTDRESMKVYRQRLGSHIEAVGTGSPRSYTLSSLGRAEMERSFFSWQRGVAEMEERAQRVRDETIAYERGMDLPRQIEKFKEFFDVNEHYMNNLLEQARNGNAWLDIDFNDLAIFCPELAELLLEKPEDVLKAWQITIEKIDPPVPADKELPRFELRIKKLSDTVRMSSLGPEHIGKLIQVEAQVLTVSERRPVVTMAKFECPSCSNIIPVLQVEQKFKEPTHCSCGRKGRFRLIVKELVAACTLLLVQPLTEMVGKKVRPSQLKVFLKNDLTRDDIRDHLGLNSMVRIVGVLHEIPIILQSGGQSTRFDLLLDAVSVQLLDHYNPQLSLSPERIAQIKADVAQPGFHERMISSMFPRHIGDDTLKVQLLCMSVALPLHLNTEETRRQAECESINIIVAGDPGMGKSGLGRRMLEFCPHGGRATGAGATKAGLTIAADTKDKENDLVIPCPGAIPNANMGLFELDELDKMELQEQTVLNEALSDHTVTITKRGVNTTLPANICFLGFANPRMKTWDLSKATIENELNIHYTLITRCIMNIQTDYAEERKDEAIASAVLNKDQAVLTPFDDEYIQDYILYARGTVHPHLREEDKKSIAKVYVSIRKELQGKFLSPRFVEQMRSLTLLHAKISLRQETRKEDVEFARKTLRSVLVAGGFESVALDIQQDSVQEKSSANAIRAPKDVLGVLRSRAPHGVYRDELLSLLDLDLSAKNAEVWLDTTIRTLSATGEIFSDKPDYWRLLP